MGSGFLELGLSKEAQDVHRALASLQEELEAIDYYHQRADVAEDETLTAILVHNRDDEMEHAVMLLEWLRRSMPALDLQLQKFMFTSEPLVDLAKRSNPAPRIGLGLGLGDLNSREQS